MTSKVDPTLDRRSFLRSSGTAAGGLFLGFFLPLPGCRVPKVPLEGEFLIQSTQPVAPPGASAAADAWINAWVRITGDGKIILRLPSSEMGQGVMTSLPMILAEELEADWNHVTVEMAPAHKAYYRTAYGSSTMMTADSQSVRGYYEILRKAGAKARSLLVQAAARSWAVPASECVARLSTVSHASSGRSLSYGALAPMAADLEVQGQADKAEPVLKPKERFTLIGTSLPRLDLRSKVTGQATFGIDVRVPGMLFASVKASPVFGGSVKQVDESALAGMPGIVKRVDLPGAVAVIADSTWRARKGVEALRITFDPGPHGGVDTKLIRDSLRAGLDEEGAVRESEGDLEKALAAATKTLDAVYEVPYVYHATLEPMNCTVHLQKERCDIWVGTQAQQQARDAASKITGLKTDQIFIHTTYLGGGFGRRGEVDYIEQAIHVAKAVDKPVQLVWSREEDIGHDRYRPAFMARLRGGIGSDGLPVAWFHRNCGQNILTGRIPALVGKIANLVAPLTGLSMDILAIQGAVDLPYALPNRTMEYVSRTFSVPVGFWRSVGHSHNAFFVECFLDELAHAGKQDPFEVRRRLLKGHPRALRVLEAAAELGGWGKAPAGRSLGIALHDSFGTLCAQVAEVSVSGDGRLTVHRVSCAVDSGIIIHPDIVTAQMEGSVGYALSAVLGEAITLTQGRVVQSNFNDYPLMPMAQMPEVQVRLLESPDAPIGGIGEPGVPPLAPAVCNALFAATGVRIRSLPLTGQKLT